MDNIIVALLGYCRVGKDEVSKTFLKHNFKQYAFGDAVKEEYAELNNLNIEDMYNSNKEFHRKGIIAHGENKRKHIENYWISLISDNIENTFNIGQDILISDLRRIPEIDYINQLKEIYGKKNVFLIHIDRPKDNGGVFDEDAESHKAINYAKFHNFIDITVMNSSTPEDLSELIETILNFQLKKDYNKILNLK